MKANIKNDNGAMIISEEVIGKIAGLTAVECFGIVGMTTTGMRDELSRILKKEHMAKGIKVKIEKDFVTIDFHIVVAYGVSIATICENLLSNVSYNIEKHTSLKVKNINVYIDGVRVID